MIEPIHVSRRSFMAASAAVATSTLIGRRVFADETPVASSLAQIAITLDLEMSRNFPVWEETRWDYEKGNLNDETKRYTVEACRRVKAAGGVLHCFAVGRVFEQADVSWLQEIAAAGHPIGNHTYDHVNVTATKPEDIQYRFSRSPWLLEGRAPAEVIRENIRLTSVAMKNRLGIDPAGFRTPGGFATGLTDRPDVQQMLLELGFKWVSSVYTPHPLGKPPENGKPVDPPGEEVFTAIVAAQAKSQPFVYPSGLVEVPMSPASDITAFRSGRWKLESFLESIRRGVKRAIENRAAYDFLAHPSCLYVTDPEFKAIDTICELVKASAGQAEIVSVGTLAKRAKNI